MTPLESGIFLIQEEESIKGIKGEKVRIVKVDVDKHKEIALTIDETYLIETIVYKKSPLTLCNS